MHFKELFEMDGRECTFTEDDSDRRTAIALLLEQWGLCELVSRPSDDEVNRIMRSLGTFKIISYAEKPEWCLVPKYRIGVRHNHI